MNQKLKFTTIAAAAIFAFLLIRQFSSDSETKSPSAPQKQAEVKVEEAQKMFGIPVDSFEIDRKVVKEGESFGNILLAHGVDYPTIHQIANDFKDVFDVRLLRSGKPYSIFKNNNDSISSARYMVYEASPVNYFVFDFDEKATVYSGKKKVSIRQKEIGGYIESSLYEALREKGGSPGLAMSLSDIYAWSIDFFHIKKGDYFKVIYEEKFIDDTISVGMGKILAADFKHGRKSYYSFHFEKNEKYSDYFDEKGKTLRKAFLKAPLNFFRISSRYSKKRFHPVLKRNKAHLGTDYAAPRGTPIMTTANGEVIAAAYTKGNGYYVKVKHNSTYTTQYLHMTKFAKGIKKGTIVKQGDVIGYVGSTGLATGPHVCYRFWKNGKQVDPYKQDLPEAEPIKKEYELEYKQHIKGWKERLDNIKLEKESKPDVYMASAGWLRFSI